MVLLSSNYYELGTPLTKNMGSNASTNLFKFSTVVNGIYLAVFNAQSANALPTNIRYDFYCTDGHLQGNLPTGNSGGYPAFSGANLYKATKTSNTLYGWSSGAYTLNAAYIAVIRLK